MEKIKRKIIGDQKMIHPEHQYPELFYYGEHHGHKEARPVSSRTHNNHGGQIEYEPASPIRSRIYFIAADNKGLRILYNNEDPGKSPELILNKPDKIEITFNQNY